jgi:hypothetical protein
MKIVQSGVEAREAVHVLLLRELRSIGPADVVVLKGGVNLRLFYGSERYSEDMDLDAEPQWRSEIRNRIGRIFDDRGFHTALRRLGLRGLDPGEGVNKDTETVFRYKFGILGRGEVRYPTKVEVSYRARHPADRWGLEEIGRSVLEAYVEPPNPLRIARYDRQAAVRQKLSALVGRTHVQARDVFDLHALEFRGPESSLVPHLVRHVEADDLRAALDRALEISFSEYEGQVVEFLSNDARDRLGTEMAWEEIRLGVAEAVESAIHAKEDA